jgi:hypothetical protein
VLWFENRLIGFIGGVGEMDRRAFAMGLVPPKHASSRVCRPFLRPIGRNTQGWGGPIIVVGSSKMDGQRRLQLAVIFVLLVAIVIVVVTNEANQNNQVVQPNPGNQPIPIQRMADIVSFLTSVKTCCENTATAAKRRRLPSGSLGQGRKLYDRVDETSADLIAYLRTALSRRFNNGDGPAIQQKLVAVDEARDLFLRWGAKTQNEAGPSKCMAAAPVDIGKMLLEWISDVRKQNDEAIKQLRDDLDRCRLDKWDTR